MSWGWESGKEKLRRSIQLAPHKKLEWLREINELLSKHLPLSRRRALRKKLLTLGP